MRRTDKGAALIIAMVMVSLVAGLVVMLFNGALTHSRTVDTAMALSESRAAAQAGLDIAVQTALNPSGPDVQIADMQTNVAMASPRAFGNTTVQTWASIEPAIGQPDADADANVELRYLTVGSTGVATGPDGHDLRTVLEAVIKVTRTTVTAPPTSGTHQVGGAASVMANGGYSHPLTIDDSGNLIHGDGWDEDLDGNATGGGVAGLGVNGVPSAGVPDPGWAPDTTIIGDPTGIKNDAASSYAAFLDQVEQGIKNLKTTDPSKVLSAPPTGGIVGSDKYNPAVVWVDWTHPGGNNNEVVLDMPNSVGYGVILVTVHGSAGSSILNKTTIIKANGSMSWKGLIIISFDDGLQLGDDSEAFWSMGGGTQRNSLFGGLGVSMKSNYPLENGGVTVRANGSADFKYSSQAISMATNPVLGLTITTTTYQDPPAVRCRRGGP